MTKMIRVAVNDASYDKLRRLAALWTYRDADELGSDPWTVAGVASAELGIALSETPDDDVVRLLIGRRLTRATIARAIRDAEDER